MVKRAVLTHSMIGRRHQHRTPLNTLWMLACFNMVLRRWGSEGVQGHAVVTSQGPSEPGMPHLLGDSAPEARKPATPQTTLKFSPPRRCTASGGRGTCQHTDYIAPPHTRCSRAC
jgi:hypothetical protein